MALNKPRPLGMCCGTTSRRGLAYMSACIIHLQSLSGHLTSAMTRSSSKSACPLLKALEFILLPSCISMAWGHFLNQLASSCCVLFRTLCPKVFGLQGYFIQFSPYMLLSIGLCLRRFLQYSRSSLYLHILPRMTGQKWRYSNNNNTTQLCPVESCGQTTCQKLTQNAVQTS